MAPLISLDWQRWHDDGAPGNSRSDRSPPNACAISGRIFLLQSQRDFSNWSRCLADGCIRKGCPLAHSADEPAPAGFAFVVAQTCASSMFIIDGEAEIVRLDGAPDFDALASNWPSHEALLWAFDLLALVQRTPDR